MKTYTKVVDDVEVRWNLANNNGTWHLHARSDERRYAWELSYIYGLKGYRLYDSGGNEAKTFPPNTPSRDVLAQCLQYVAGVINGANDHIRKQRLERAERQSQISQVVNTMKLASMDAEAQ